MICPFKSAAKPAVACTECPSNELNKITVITVHTQMHCNKDVVQTVRHMRMMHQIHRQSIKQSMSQRQLLTVSFAQTLTYGNKSTCLLHVKSNCTCGFHKIQEQSRDVILQQHQDASPRDNVTNISCLLSFFNKDIVKCNATHMQSSITRYFQHFYPKNTLHLLNWLFGY